MHVYSKHRNYMKSMFVHVCACIVSLKKNFCAHGQLELQLQFSCVFTEVGMHQKFIIVDFVICLDIAMP